MHVSEIQLHVELLIHVNRRENQRQINTDPAALRQTSRARRGEVLQQVDVCIQSQHTAGL